MVDNFVKVVEAVSKLVGALAWPLVVLIVVWWFRKPLLEFIARIKEGSVKLGFLELRATQAAAEAAVTAELAREASGSSTASIVMATAVGKSHRLADWLRHIPLAELNGRTVLLVDDQPDNNYLEVKSLEALGIRVVFAKSTPEALELLNGADFDVIISDMARPHDEQAGYSLLAKVRTLRPNMPFILYTSAHTTEQARSIISQGAYGSTSRASELVELVVTAIGGAAYTQWSRARTIRNMQENRASWRQKP